MERMQLFVFCDRQARFVALLEKLKVIEVESVLGGDHPITKKLMCQIVNVKMSEKLFWKIQKIMDWINDGEGKRRIAELERIGYLKTIKRS